jgi:hypothetical protein
MTARAVATCVTRREQAALPLTDLAPDFVPEDVAALTAEAICVRAGRVLGREKTRMPAAIECHPEAEGFLLTVTLDPSDDRAGQQIAETLKADRRDTEGRRGARPRAVGHGVPAEQRTARTRAR